MQLPGLRQAVIELIELLSEKMVQSYVIYQAKVIFSKWG